jgi:hypothetical protein
VADVIGFHMTAGRSLIYVLAGAVGILLALLAGTARLYGWLLLIGFAALVLWGLAVVGTFSSNPVSGMGNPLHLGVSDNWWHAGGLLLALLVVVFPARRVIVTDEPEPVEERAAEPAVAPTTTDERDHVVARTEHEDRHRDAGDLGTTGTTGTTGTAGNFGNRGPEGNLGTGENRGTTGNPVNPADPAMAAHTERMEPPRHERMEPMPEVATDETAEPRPRKHKWNPFNRDSQGTTPGYR